MSPQTVLLLLCAFMVMTWMNEFMKALASEAGKKAGQNAAEIIAHMILRRGRRLGFGLIGSAVVVATAFAILSAGVILIAHPDCNTQQSGYILVSSTVGFFI